MLKRNRSAVGAFTFNFGLLPGLLSLAALILLITSVANKTHAAASPQTAALVAASPAEVYAEKVSGLVHSQNLAALAALPPPPAATTDAAMINRWRQEYVTTMLKQRAENQKLYTKWLTTGQKDFKANKLIPAFEYMLTAYGFSQQKAAFKKQPWVQSLTAKIAAKAAQYDKQHRWLASLQLYNQLNTMYRISKGKHTLVIKALDNHVLIDQWMLDFKPERRFYMFPLSASY